MIIRRYQKDLRLIISLFAVLCLSWVGNSDAFLPKSANTASQVDHRRILSASLQFFDGPESSQSTELSETLSRRAVLEKTTSSFFLGSIAFAANANADDDEFVTRGNRFAYRFVPPEEMEQGTKPVKTHLFEINWKSKTTPKYTFGITIDPVRIQNLKEVRSLNNG